MMMNGELAGFTIPRLGMGTMALAIEGRPDRDTAIRTIHAGLDAGVRYLDTAWSYYLPSEPGTGTAKDLGYGEKLVRDALASWDGPRDEVLVATKTGYRRTMEVPAFVAPVSDSGESDKQGVPKRTRMADSPESDKRKASVRRRNYRLQGEIRLHQGRATARWWHATEAMWQSAIINRKHVPHFRGQDRQSNGMRLSLIHI